MTHAAVGRWLQGAAIAAIALALDQATKAAVLAGALPSDGEILPVLNLVLVRNRGISFGILSGAGIPAGLFTILGVGLVALLAVWLARAADRITAVALGLMIGGALGNIIDRIRQGAVTDFIDLHAGGWHWPAFNLADVAICSGVVLLLLAGLRKSGA